MAIKSWPKLVISIFIAQMAGAIGSVFTISAIPTWYAFLNKPSFSPPNWLFGPVWTILYTMIGISLYRMWLVHNKKTFWSVKLFLLHLFLNAIWTPIFFGLKNLGLAFLVILFMDISLVVMIYKFYRIDKLASLLLIPYLMWISFASLLNFSIWKLNPNNTVKNVFAQDLTFTKSREDYVFVEDNYKKDLFDYNLKKDSYLKNPTLSLKEEFRLSLYTFVGSRDDLLKSYLTMVRTKIVESTGIDSSHKDTLFSKIDAEVSWIKERGANYSTNDRLEDIISKSKEEDTKYKTDTLPAIYYSLASISLGNVRQEKDKQVKLYNNLKDEANNLVTLGRADASLFDRWFKDIDQELNNISTIENNTQVQIDKIYNSDSYTRGSSYKKAIDTISVSKSNLLRLNGFIKELDNVIEDKR